MVKGKIHIDQLIEVVEGGGRVKTGIDVYNDHGVLLLERDVLVTEAKPLYVIKQNGVRSIPISPKHAGGLWDKEGHSLPVVNEKAQPLDDSLEQDPLSPDSDLVHRLTEINRIKEEAAEKYRFAKKNIKKVIADLKNTGGEFEYEEVESTVSNLLEFLTANESAFSYLTKEIFSYDEYLYNHAINVCAVGTAILRKFNQHFSNAIEQHVLRDLTQKTEPHPDTSQRYSYYTSDEIRDISIGFFMHDLGKVLIPDEILNKKGRLTSQEFEIVKTHAHEKGEEILSKNNITNPFITNTVRFHHSPLYGDEKNCYPDLLSPQQIPLYVKICKLADIYDAMTSKRCYKEALNPVGVVTDIFRKFADKNRILQFLLHSFVKVVGIYPPGSIVHLMNGQMGYVIDSQGPIILPFEIDQKESFSGEATPVDLSYHGDLESAFSINRREPLLSPAEAYNWLPDHLKTVNNISA
jgi:HD-GYP domain-containing protein (c-di-GMP phosphodiesterase class II)